MASKLSGPTCYWDRCISNTFLKTILTSIDVKDQTQIHCLFYVIDKTRIIKGKAK
jgi:hypothetical protein